MAPADVVICPRCQQPTRRPTCAWCDLLVADGPVVAAPSSRSARGYAMLRGLMQFEAREQIRTLRHLIESVIAGAIVGTIAGLTSAGFLVSLAWATRTRTAHSWLVWLLPAAGLAIGLTYGHVAGRAGGGNALVVDELHTPTQRLPTRMAPLSYLATIATHLFGGSAGREGVAIQMSASLTDVIARPFGIDSTRRHVLLVAAVAGGIGAVFGVPLAGCIFALEWQRVGGQIYRALVPALAASVVGDRVVRALAVKHTVLPRIDAVPLDAASLIKVTIAGVGFGLVALVFIELTNGIRRVCALLARPTLRPVIGGVVIVLLAVLVGTNDYLGLSIPLATAAVNGGAGIVAGAFALKLLFTSITLGTGFQGGEVTPLFVIGATMGVPLAHVLHLPAALLASVGFVAVFAAAANTPLACTVMGIEMFGAAPAIPLAIGCTVAYLVSSDRGIYASQRIASPKDPSRDAVDEDTTLSMLAQRRRYWLAPRATGQDGVDRQS